MRVPTREGRDYLAREPGVRIELHRDDRIPLIATPSARNAIRVHFREAYREASRSSRLDAESYAGAWQPLPGEVPMTRRLAAILQETRWQRVLAFHRLAERE